MTSHLNTSVKYQKKGDKSGSLTRKFVIQIMMEILNLESFDHILTQVRECQKPDVTGTSQINKTNIQYSDNTATKKHKLSSQKSLKQL